MKPSVIMFVSLFASCAPAGSHSINEPILRPIFQSGTYQLHVRRVLPCVKTKQDKFDINLRLNKISPTTAELEGNITFEIPLDDKIRIHAYFDQKKSNGGWSTNSILIKKDKACSALKSLVLEKYLPSIGYVNATCPVPVGFRIVKGLPGTNMEVIFEMLPNFILYGQYRFRFILISKNNEQIGCFHAVLEILRPWEN